MGNTAMRMFNQCLCFVLQVSKAATNTVFVLSVTVWTNQTGWCQIERTTLRLQLNTPQCTHAFWHKMSCVCLIRATPCPSPPYMCWGQRGKVGEICNHHLVASLRATSQVRTSQNKPGTQSSVCPDDQVIIALKVNYKSKSQGEITN